MYSIVVYWLNGVLSCFSMFYPNVDGLDCGCWNSGHDMNKKHDYMAGQVNACPVVTQNNSYYSTDHAVGLSKQLSIN